MKIRPNIWLTSDFHFGHSKMWNHWKHREEGFEEDLIEAWNSVVGKKDIVLHLGDLTLANKEKTKDWTSKLKGKKYLILGNHDGHSVGWYADVGFTVIPDAYQVFRSWDENMKVLFTHEPVIPLPVGWFNIHGHLHGDNHRGIKASNWHHDVGVDAIGFKPVKLVTIIEHFRAVI